AAAAVLIGGLLADYQLLLLVSWVINGLLALSLSLVWGQGGILSFGQTAFYGAGAYMYGVLAINLAPWTGGNTLIWAFVAAVLGGGLLAAALGYFLFYGEVGDVQTTVVTVAATLIMFTVAIGLQFRVGDAFVGGDNGMIGIPPLAVGWGDDPLYLMPRGLFNATVLIAALMYIVVKGLMARPFGLIVNAVRINPLRTSLLGYDVRRYRFLVFTLGGAIAGLAGALYAAWGGFVSPAVFGLHDAARVVTWVLVGGKGSLAGAFVGALGVESFTYWLSGGVAGGQTTLVLGSALIVAVLSLPGGVTGVIHTVRSGLRLHMRTAGEHPSNAPDQSGTGAV